MLHNLKKTISWSVALSLIKALAVSGIPVESEAVPCGITLRDKKEPFTIFRKGSVAPSLEHFEDGSLSWVSTASGGGGGGVSFYFKPNKEEINISNYESMDIELDYSVVEDKWSPEAKNPSFCIRILPWDSTGIFGGYVDLECFDTDKLSGSYKHHITIPSNFVDKIIATSDFDYVLGFAVKFNDYKRGNKKGDQLRVHLKNVQFNAKENAGEDQLFDDGLTPEQHGSVIDINYPTRDYTVEEDQLTEEDRYNKHAYLYLPAGFDASDKNTTYPVVFLLHGVCSDENAWGVTTTGRGGKIKGYLDRGIAKGEVEKQIVAVINDVASKGFKERRGRCKDVKAYYALDGEIRNDLLPFLRENFNVREGRENVAMAGFSLGGVTTFNAGVSKALDIIANFGSFSGEFRSFETLNQTINENPRFDGLKIKNLYMTCGDADILTYKNYPEHVKAMKQWDRVEHFTEYTYPGGSHDFPVWYNGFREFIHLIFKSENEEPTKN